MGLQIKQVRMCNFASLRGNYDRPTNQQIDGQTDIRGHKKVTLLIMIVVVGGMGGEVVYCRLPFAVYRG